MTAVLGQNVALRHYLNHISEATYAAKLGDVVYDLIIGYNDLSAKYALLLAHLDTANVAGIGNQNAATYGVTARLTILLPENRTADSPYYQKSIL